MRAAAFTGLVNCVFFRSAAATPHHARATLCSPLKHGVCVLHTVSRGVQWAGTAINQWLIRAKKGAHALGITQNGGSQSEGGRARWACAGLPWRAGGTCWRGAGSYKFYLPKPAGKATWNETANCEPDGQGYPSVPMGKESDVSCGA